MYRTTVRQSWLCCTTVYVGLGFKPIRSLVSSACLWRAHVRLEVWISRKPPDTRCIFQGGHTQALSSEFLYRLPRRVSYSRHAAPSFPITSMAGSWMFSSSQIRMDSTVVL